MNPACPEDEATTEEVVTPAPPLEKKRTPTHPERLYFGGGILSLIILAAIVAQGIRGELAPSETLAIGLLPIALGLFCIWKEHRITGRWFWEPFLGSKKR